MPSYMVQSVLTCQPLMPPPGGGGSWEVVELPFKRPIGICLVVGDPSPLNRADQTESLKLDLAGTCDEVT